MNLQTLHDYYHLVKEKQEAFVQDYLTHSHEHIIAKVFCSTDHFNNIMGHISYEIAYTNTGTIICTNGDGTKYFHTITDDPNIDSLYSLVCKSIKITRNGIEIEYYDTIIMKMNKNVNVNVNVDVEMITKNTGGMITLREFENTLDYLRTPVDPMKN